MTAGYVLVLIACLNGTCERHVVARGLTATACMASSQIEAARWVGDHPEWRISMVRCELGDAT